MVCFTVRWLKVFMQSHLPVPVVPVCGSQFRKPNHRSLTLISQAIKLTLNLKNLLHQVPYVSILFFMDTGVNGIRPLIFGNGRERWRVADARG